ncbi:HAD family hydrolase [Blautia sp. HCN-1074]|uniref:HAD family hydrolase n=1 Tax=Blautia sp. HCN-1074 TaxID=3134667 RepID=UPI0030C54C01
MKKDNNKLKKAGACIAIVILLLACCLPMFFAFGSGENSQNYFKASLAVAIMVPILAYAIWMVYKLLNKNKKVVESDMENIIFDVGKVLVKFEWEKYLDSFGFPKEKRDKIAKAVFESETWNERDRSSEDEQYYVDKMIKDAPEYADDIREVMRRSGETIERMDYAETWVRYLKDKGYHVYILSNYATYTLEKTEEELTFLKYVDGAVFSCQVKQIKPEPDIYQTLIKRYNLDPQKSVFLDDRKENCEAARKQGIHAIQFESFKQAAAELEKLGVK